MLIKLLLPPADNSSLFRQATDMDIDISTVSISFIHEIMYIILIAKHLPNNEKKIVTNINRQRVKSFLRWNPISFELLVWSLNKQIAEMTRILFNLLIHLIRFIFFRRKGTITLLLLLSLLSYPEKYVCLLLRQNCCH